MQDCFFAWGSSAPVRVERECGTAAWVAGTLAVPTAQTRTASATGVMALSEAFFEPLVAGAGPVLLTLLFPPLVPSSYQVLHGSIYSFPLPGNPVRSQLVFCMHFCVLRCVPDASMERDVLHVHLLLHHLVLLPGTILIFAFWICWHAFSHFIWFQAF